MSSVRVSSVSVGLRALVLCGAAALALTAASPVLAQAVALQGGDWATIATEADARSTAADAATDAARARADQLLAQMTQAEKLAMCMATSRRWRTARPARPSIR